MVHEQVSLAINLAFVSLMRVPPLVTDETIPGIGRLPVKERDKGKRPLVSFPWFRTGVVHTFSLSTGVLNEDG